jgi:hypothetical protein
LTESSFFEHDVPIEWRSDLDDSINQTEI